MGHFSTSETQRRAAGKGFASPVLKTSSSLEVQGESRSVAGTRVCSLCIATYLARPGYYGSELCRARKRVRVACETRQEREKLWSFLC